MGGEIWELERGLWLGGPEQFRASMVEDCVMVFPEPIGVLRGSAILAGVDGAPRWAELRMVDRHLSQPIPEVAVVAYRAEAARSEGARYWAFCSSVWLRTGGLWRIAQHQQTPVG